MIQDFATRLIGRRTKTTAQNEAAYDRLISSVADGKEPPEEEAERIIAAAGKTPADLETDVRTLTHRRRLAEMTKEEAPLRAEMRELEKRRAKVSEDFAAAREKCFEEEANLRVQIDAIIAKLYRIDAAKTQLVNTSPTRREVGDVIAAAQSARLRMSEAERELREANGKLTGLRREQENGSRVPNMESLIARAQANVRNIEARFESAKREWEEAGQRARELHAAGMANL